MQHDLERVARGAAGGDHDDWAEYDRARQHKRRTAVLVIPDRVYSN